MGNQRFNVDVKFKWRSGSEYRDKSQNAVTSAYLFLRTRIAPIETNIQKTAGMYVNGLTCYVTRNILALGTEEMMIISRDI